MATRGTRCCRVRLEQVAFVVLPEVTYEDAKGLLANGGSAVLEANPAVLSLIGVIAFFI